MHKLFLVLSKQPLSTTGMSNWLWNWNGGGQFKTCSHQALQLVVTCLGQHPELSPVPSPGAAAPPMPAERGGRLTETR